MTLILETPLFKGTSFHTFDLPIVFLGIESTVVLNHVPTAGDVAANISSLNDADENTCITLPSGDGFPWEFKVKMESVPNNNLVKIVPDGDALYLY